MVNDIRVAARSLEVPGPATLWQGDWQHHSAFVTELHNSWLEQYADYLGTEAATILVDRLVASGEILSHHAAGTVLANADDKLVGIACLRPLGGLALITILEVVEAYRGKGIGHQLVSALLTIDQPLLAHVSIHRPRVNDFYRSLGFKQIERTSIDHHGYQLPFDVLVR